MRMEELFEQMTPPAGGLQRLRRRLKSPRPAYRPRLWPALAASALVLVVLSWVRPWDRPPAAPMPEALRLTAAAFAPVTDTEPTISGGEAVKLLETDTLVVYRALTPITPDSAVD